MDEKIIEYLMNSPENTNPSVLGSMLKSKGTEIKTVVIKGVFDQTTKKVVYTPNMTYEEARDMLLNLEPFNVVFINDFPEPSWIHIIQASYDAKNNRIGLYISNNNPEVWWSATGIEPALPAPR